MTISQSVIRDKLHKLIEEYAEYRYCQEILLFLERHPHARFGHPTIIRALNGSRWGTEQALNHLTHTGVVRKYVENGVTLYSLSVDE